MSRNLGPILIAVLACTSPGMRGPESASPGLLITRGELRATEGVSSAPFGGAVPGRAAWLSRGGRIALIYRFDRDTDDDGRVEVEFGHHGNALKDEPRPWVYDLTTGRGAEWDEHLATDPRDRYIALARGDTVTLLDAETGEARELPGVRARTDADANRCLPPRQLSFDDAGKRIAFIEGTPPVLDIRDLRTNAESRIAPEQGYLWRAFFTGDRDWMMLFVVDTPSTGESAAFPRQRTSCACRVCNLFAMSYSFMGWEGAPFRARLASPDGRQLAVPVSASPVGRAGYVVPDSAKAYRWDRSAIPLPAGCDSLHVIPNAAVLLLQCTDGARIFDPALGHEWRLDRPVEPVEEAGAVSDSVGARWIAVLVGATGQRDLRRLARLRLEDGRLETGPGVESASVGDGGAWAVGSTSRTVHPLDVRSGEVWSQNVPGVWATRGLLTILEDRRAVVLHPRAGTYLVVGAEAGAANDAGCILVAAGTRRSVDVGPWTRRCVEAPSQSR
jgi:hypothetical protein